MDRTYTTRELAQMWNISESTVKRWADTSGLRCQRTPGGHRRFFLADIQLFQKDRGFEATGLLTTESWEDPRVEDLLNRKDFIRVREQVRYLAMHNQRKQIEELLKRLYLRGVPLEHIYDSVVIPVISSSQNDLSKKTLNLGQSKLIQVNVEKAVSYLFPHIIRKQEKGKTSLCSSPFPSQSLSVNAAARVLEIEGWEVLNLGWSVPFAAMASIVEEEPINMVCIVSSGTNDVAALADIETLIEVVSEYHLPIVMVGEKLICEELDFSSIDSYYFSDFSSFQSFIASRIPSS